MSRSRLEAILANLQLSKSKVRNQQVLDFIDAFNICFKSAINMLLNSSAWMNL